MLDAEWLTVVEFFDRRRQFSTGILFNLGHFYRQTCFESKRLAVKCSHLLAGKGEVYKKKFWVVT